MYLCIWQQLRHLSKEDYGILWELCYVAKNLYNESMYQIRQHFFESEEYLPYVKNYHQIKERKIREIRIKPQAGNKENNENSGSTDQEMEQPLPVK